MIMAALLELIGITYLIGQHYKYFNNNNNNNNNRV